MVHLVADLGNSRLKWGRLSNSDSSAGQIEAVQALPLDEPQAWYDAAVKWGLIGSPSRWAIASVNPPLAVRLRSWIETTFAEVDELVLLTSAVNVPVPHRLDQPERTGVDRALAVFEAMQRQPGRAGQVVSCGTALTIERITADGVWCGGAIAPGLGLSARALNQLTAQLPLIPPPHEPPTPWGGTTEPALSAGVFWGTVGALREILARQREGLGEDPWQVWTGGDAAILARHGGSPSAQIHHDLVLEGLARLVYSATGST